LEKYGVQTTIPSVLELDVDSIRVFTTVVLNAGISQSGPSEPE